MDYYALRSISPLTLLLTLIAVLAQTPNAGAAACCGGNSSLPLLIVTDDQSIWQLTFNNSAVVKEVDSLGESQPYDNNFREVNETLNLGAAFRVSDYWQWAGEIRAASNMRAIPNLKERSLGLSEAVTRLSFEFLPQLVYHPWQPSAFAFLELTAPIGSSTYESSKTLSTDSFNEGLWKLSAGTAFHRVWNAIDAQFALSTGFYFSRDIKGSPVSSGPEVKSTLSGGYSFFSQKMRLGTAVTYRFQDGKEVGTQAKSGALTLGTVSAGMSYRFPVFSLSASYYDQGVLPSRNTLLSRGLVFQFARYFAL